MPKRKNDSLMQPKLLAEPQSEYQPTSEELAEKEHYRQRLAEHLKDPAFRQIEGFPNGEDEAILALSDPPYYTACPNPFMGEIIARWQQERQALRKELGLPDNSRENGIHTYHREPFAADVSEGKNDPIYNAHSYHTKVPHKAIMRYILHYTEPSDIVLDGFCGTGMTGVAAQLCGDKKTIESLGYTVQTDGQVLDENGQAISRLGARHALLVDLSPAATFIAYNYNTPIDAQAFEREAELVLREVENECGWMYETWHPHCDDPNRAKGKINFTVWSDVLVCPQCGSEMVFWDVAVDQQVGQVREEWDCPHCNIHLSKSPKKGSGAQRVERAFETIFDRVLGINARRAKQVPVLINYFVGTDPKKSKRYEKRPDANDYSLIDRIGEGGIQYSFPVDSIPKGDKTSDPFNLGITNVHHFYTHRSLSMLATLRGKISKDQTSRISRSLEFLWQSLSLGYTKLNRYGATHYSQVNRILSGTLYVSSLLSEVSINYAFSGKLTRLAKAFSSIGSKNYKTTISAQSSTNISLVDESCDYIFIDPPFGSNLMYSELNFLWEAWLGVYTNNQSEAVVNRIQRKGLPEYQGLMEACFREFYRALKPGRWMTVEFHNSQNAVWNAIQEAILQAGFMVADVRTLDKQQGSFNQATSSGAVKQDLVISAYKPTTAFVSQFKSEAGSLQGAWSFIRQHLEQLPLPAVEKGVVETLSERQAYLLYDRMVAFHLVRGLSLPISSPEFYQGLAQRFLERDGMYFTPAQAAEYDKLRLKAERVEQLALFVTDEKSAVQWLRQALDPSLNGEPQTYQDLQPKFIQQLHQARHEKLPELRQMLEENFLQDEAERWYNPNPDHKADLEALRQRTLLREYKEYLKGKGRLKIFRSEAVRAGFSVDWKERNYADIVQIAERLPESVLQEDQGLLMYYHNASLRLSEKPKQAKLF
jgi:DNA modification methylase/rubredoxin